MKIKNINRFISKASLVLIPLIYSACSTPTLVKITGKNEIPKNYSNSKDSSNASRINWKDFFSDPNLIALIDTALSNNQELNIMVQEISIARNEVRARKGAYLPFISYVAGAGVEKVGDYTSQGASDLNNNIMPGRKFPNPLPNYFVGLNASWEIDIWRKLTNSKKAAAKRYLSSIEAKNFMVTNLVAEIANAYYELMALDNELDILKQNIEIQTNALAIVKLEKLAARVTELAVRRFEAEVLKNQSHIYFISQQIVETENKINFLVGRFPQPIARDSRLFNNLNTKAIPSGIPKQLLENRPDIRKAELELQATKFDIASAKTQFYPSLFVSSGLGLQAFDTKYLFKTPQSLLYSLGSQIVGPLINRNAIKANYLSANARQIQAAYNFHRTVLKAYIEVANQLSNIDNLERSYDFKSQQVQTLVESIDISSRLFKSARADYMEVLLTQRDALESKFELTETKMKQMNARINIYRALGGGWQ